MLDKLITRYRNAYSGVPRNVWLIALVLLVSRCGTMVLPFLSIYCTREMGFQPKTIGSLLGCYGAGAILGGLAGGKLTEWIGPIRTQLLSLALSIPGYLLVGLATDFWTLAGSLFVLSLCVESMRPACATATINFCERPEQHTRAMAVNRLAVNLGTTFGPAIGGFLALVNYDWLFYANSFSMFCAFLLMLFFFGKQTSVGAVSMESTNENDSTASPFRDGRFISFCLLNVLAACAFFQIMGTYPLYLEEQYGLKENHIGLLFAINTIVIVLFELLLVDAIKDWSLLRVFGWGHLLSCIGFGILPFASGSPFGMAVAFCSFSMLILTVGEMLSMPTGPTYAARRSTSSNRGKYMGVYVTSFSIASLIAPLGGMALYQIHPDLVWYACLIIGAIVFAGMMVIEDRDKSDEQKAK